MSNVIELFPMLNVPTALRNIADDIEAEILSSGTTGCTIIMDTLVFHAGEIDNAEAAVNAIWNMTVGIHKLMRPVVDQSLETT